MIGIDGLRKGLKVIDTRVPLSVSIGETTLGLIVDVLEEPVDNLGLVNASTTHTIHRFALAFT